MSELFNLTPAAARRVTDLEFFNATDRLSGFIADKAVAAVVTGTALQTGVIATMGLKYDVYDETLTTSKGGVINVPNTPDKSGRDRCKVYVPALKKSRSVSQVLVMMILDAACMGYPTGYEVHHINGDHSDNAIRNLVVVTPASHKRLHYLMDEVARGYKTVEEYMRVVEEVRVRF